MSVATIIVFKDGLPSTSLEYSNSHLGASFIWGSLYDKYLLDPNKKYDCWINNSLEGKDQRLWDLAFDERLTCWERAVHVSTFDMHIVQRKNFQRFSEDLYVFATDHQKHGHLPCHLWRWHADIRRCKGEAIGFWHTSVSDNLWNPCNPETGESEPYNLNTGKKHREVYEEVERYTARIAYGVQLHECSAKSGAGVADG